MCWSAWTASLLDRALVERREVPDVEVRRPGRERDDRVARRPAASAARARQQRLQQRAGQAEHDQQRAEVGQQQVLEHVREEQLLADVRERRDQRRHHQHQPAVEAPLPPAGTGAPRARSVRARSQYMTPTTTAGASCSGATSKVTWATSDKLRSAGSVPDMSDRTTPPFRADHVGSLLRPPELLAGARGLRRRPDRRRRAARDRGRRDPRRRASCRRTSACSRRPTASSAARRGTWTSSTSSAASRSRPGNLSGQVPQRRRRHRVHAGRDAHRRQGHAREADLRRATSSSCRACVTSATPKLTIPSPSMVHYRGGRAAIEQSVYPDMDQFWDDLTTAYADQVAAIGDLGCTYLQFDDTSLAYLNDPNQRAEMAAKGDDAEHLHEAYIRHINEALAQAPRGHGDHDPHVPRQLPLARGSPRAATTSSPRRCSTSSPSTASSWSGTTRARAASSRCASCPRARSSCSAS